jgi:hypothetical protein
MIAASAETVETLETSLIILREPLSVKNSDQVDSWF